MDDFLHCGNEAFNKNVVDSVSSTFLVSKREIGCFLYTGFNIKQNENQIVIDQNQYIANLDIPDISADRSNDKRSPLNSSEKSDLRRMAGTLNWLVTRQEF